MNKSQPSITEWFEAIGEQKDSKAFRKEDNHKADRLETLYQTISLPYERPIKLSARDLADKSLAFQKILKNQGDELCAIRLVPINSKLPKLRNRGLSVRQCYETWFLKQTINPNDYIAYICPHVEKLLWSTIFVINQEEIFGEIIRGGHSQLTHGDTHNKLYQFRYNFKNWQWSSSHIEFKNQIKQITKLLKILDKKKQLELRKYLKVKFSHNYICGYFEAVIWPNNQIYFIDYNRILPKYLPTPPPLNKNKSGKKEKLLTGIPAHPGIIKGKVIIIKPNQIRTTKFLKDAVLVCDNTDVRYLPLMKKSSAIITNQGGILSHAAIIARELKIPCIIDTKNATKILTNGDIVKIDADKGVIRYNL